MKKKKLSYRGVVTCSLGHILTPVTDCTLLMPYSNPATQFRKCSISFFTHCKPSEDFSPKQNCHKKGGGGGDTSVLSMKGPRALLGYNNNNDDGLLKYTRQHKNYELQCAYMIQEIKLHLFRRDWDYRLFISCLQF